MMPRTANSRGEIVVLFEPGHIATVELMAQLSWLAAAELP
jgi:hypothetical protein